MNDDLSKNRLGRGLAALLGDVGAESAAEKRLRSQRRVPIEFLRPNPMNPRVTFHEADLEELAQSIRERDIIQPIVVRGVPGVPDAFEIIAGERRWRGAQRAGLHDVPVVIIEADDKQALELAIIENVQRADLNALEEARGYESLILQYGYTQSDLSQILGKSRSHVANTLRLARLPDGVKEKLASGALSAGHARALITAPDPGALAHEVLAKGLNVRQTEALARQAVQGPGAPRPARRGGAGEASPDIAALEQDLADVLGLKVQLAYRDGRGDLTIRFGTLEQLDDLCRRLMR